MEEKQLKRDFFSFKIFNWTKKKTINWYLAIKIIPPYLCRDLNTRPKNRQILNPWTIRLIIVTTTHKINFKWRVKCLRCNKRIDLKHLKFLGRYRTPVCANPCMWDHIGKHSRRTYVRQTILHAKPYRWTPCMQNPIGEPSIANPDANLYRN